MKRFILVVISLLLAGCWDRMELNDIAIVSGMAVDEGKKAKYAFTVSIVNPQELARQGSSGQTPIITYTQEGNSIADLSTKMNIGLARNLSYSHTRTLIVSEAVAKRGIEFLDFLERSTEFRNDFNILVARNSEARRFLQTMYPFPKVPAIKLNKQIESLVNEWGGDPRVRLTDFISATASTGRVPVAAAVKLIGAEEAGMTKDATSTSHQPSFVTMAGMAVFQANQLRGYLNLEDTRNYLWTQRLQRTSISLACNRQSPTKQHDFRIWHTKLRPYVTWQRGKVYIRLEVTGEATLQGSECAIDLTKTKVYSKLAILLNQEIKRQLVSTVRRVQHNGKVDVFGFGEVMSRQEPKAFKRIAGKWHNEFSQAVIIVHSNVHVRRAGMNNKSFLVSPPSS